MAAEGAPARTVGQRNAWKLEAHSSLTVPITTQCVLRSLWQNSVRGYPLSISALKSATKKARALASKWEAPWKSRAFSVFPPDCHQTLTDSQKKNTHSPLSLSLLSLLPLVHTLDLAPEFSLTLPPTTLHTQNMSASLYMWEDFRENILPMCCVYIDTHPLLCHFEQLLMYSWKWWQMYTHTHMHTILLFHTHTCTHV